MLEWLRRMCVIVYGGIFHEVVACHRHSIKVGMKLSHILAYDCRMFHRVSLPFCWTASECICHVVVSCCHHSVKGCG